MTDPTGRGPTPDLDPGGINGDDYSRRLDAEIAWLARRVPRRLTVSGTNALTGTTPAGDPPIAALATGMRISFVPVANNTTAVTLNPDGLGAISVVDDDGTALATGQLRNGRPVEGVIYSDGKLRLTSGLSAPATPPKIAIITNSRTNAYGGTLSAGSNNTLSLNTLLYDEIGITGTLPTFTIPAGTWDIDLVAAISDVDAVQLRLRNTTDSTDVTTVIGTAGRLPTANADHEVSLRGRITLASAKSFQVWARVSTSITNEAQGGAQESGDSWFTSNQLNYARLLITEARSNVAGPAATIAVGTVTEIAAGATPTVVNAGTSSNAILDFEFPAPFVGEGIVDAVAAGDGILVDSTDPAIPEVSVIFGTGAGSAAEGNDSRIVGALQKGRQAFYIPAGAVKPKATNGAGQTSYDSGSNDLTLDVLAFDSSTQEYAQFEMAMPKGWNRGTIAFRPYWTNTAGLTTETVVWSLAARSFRDDDSLNQTPGTPQTSTDTWLAQNDLHIGPESAAITISGTLTDPCLVVFELSRVVASDTLTGDALLIGIELYLSFDGTNDA